MSYLSALGVVAYYVNERGLGEASLHSVATDPRLFVPEPDSAGSEQNPVLLRTTFREEARLLLRLYVSPEHGPLVTAALRMLCPAWRDANWARPPRLCALYSELRRVFARCAGVARGES